MKGFFISLGIMVGIPVILILSVVGVWNSLNRNLQNAEGAKSHYSAALGFCTEKIQGVWIIANQYLDHESSTFKAVAEARSGYKAASDAFEKAAAEGKGTKELTEAGNGVVQAALAFRVQIEAYPQLRATETTQSNIRNMQEAVNEMKTALDDWIAAIRKYNTYRGSAWPSIAGSFMAKFPSEIEYYEGKLEIPDIGSLNPRA